ncbi:MAG: hypothetical protein GTN99_08525 [Candidatus Dadabacteria bacterium]|nr:hypothetical protein [Candidatus Dadabacteria bacterium]
MSLLAFFLVKGIPTVSAESDDITTLIQTANTPEDHMKIAEYYNKQAENMDQMVKMHESMGEAYSKRSKPMKGMTNHCAKLSTDSKKSAEQYREMAQEHEQMAHQMMDPDSH